MPLRFSKFYTVFFFVLAAALPHVVSAMHIIGGEITYECLGPGDGSNTKRYRFTMKIYRDCNGGGAQFDDPAEMAIYRGTENANSLWEAFRVYDPQIVHLIPDTPQCVEKVPNVCVERAIYMFEKDLPVLANESYFVVYQRCCRNVTINNINNPGDVGATYMIELTPAAMTACNNSPVFTNFPPIVICKDVPLDFDHSVTDADGDQVVYSFCSPLVGGGPLLQPESVLESCEGAKPTPPCGPPFDPVPFAVPTYTMNNPIASTPIVAIDPVTGLITGTPKLLGQFVVGVCVQEFRNGVLLSTVRRDFQFNVADCEPTVLANLDSTVVVGQQNFVINSCGNNTVTLRNASVQEQYIESFQWQFDINGTPLLDSTNWDLTVTFPGIGSYSGLLVLNKSLNCGDTAFVTVNIFPAINAEFDFLQEDSCVVAPISFADLSTGEGGINQWNWQFGLPGATSSDRNPFYQYEVPGTFPVMLTVVDANACRDSVVHDVPYYPAPPTVIIAPDSALGCAPQEVFFENRSAPLDSTYNIVWDFGDGATSNEISPTHVYAEPGRFDVRLSITSPIGCHVEDTFIDLIRVRPSPTADFTFDPSSNLSNLNNTVQFNNLSTNADRFNWQFDRFATSTKLNPVFTFPDTGIMRVRLIATHPEGCQDSIVKLLDIRPEIRWFMPNAFTPNGDGTNDGFLGKGFLFGATNFEMTIWNRWGELVFETNNPDDAWNGRVLNTGTLAQAGVYVYLVRFTGPRGEAFEFKGYATLIK
jgi:gliding motility-associated-like protein